MNVVLDVNVFVSAALSRRGTPARLIRSWQDGTFELVVSPLLLAELERVLEHPKFQGRIAQQDATDILEALSVDAVLMEDPSRPPSVVSRDDNDNYLVALAEQSKAVLVTGDGDLLGLAAHVAVMQPAELLRLLDEAGLS